MPYLYLDAETLVGRTSCTSSNNLLIELSQQFDHLLVQYSVPILVGLLPTYRYSQLRFQLFQSDHALDLRGYRGRPSLEKNVLPGGRQYQLSVSLNSLVFNAHAHEPKCTGETFVLAKGMATHFGLCVTDF